MSTPYSTSDVTRAAVEDHANAVVDQGRGH